jgi:hypothetical protein
VILEQSHIRALNSRLLNESMGSALENARLALATAIARVTEPAAYSSRARRGLAVLATTKAETTANSSAGDDRLLCARSGHSQGV